MPAGHDAAQLGVVEHHRVRLVTEQPGSPVRVGRRDRVRGHVHQARGHAERRGQGQRDLVPGEHVVRGDVEGLAERPRVAEQRDERAREVIVMGHRPQRGPVAVDDDGLAREHPAQHRPPAVERHQGLVVGVRGPHDRGREAAVTVGADEQVLAGDLVAGVQPERVAQRRGLGDGQPRGRRLVRRRRADEHVLPGPAAEQVDVGLDLPGGEGHPVDYGVKFKIFNFIPNGPRFPYIAPQHRDPGRQRPVGVPAPVQHEQLDAVLDRDPRARRADDPAAADEQDPELCHALTLYAGLPRRSGPGRCGMPRLVDGELTAVGHADRG